MNGTTQEIMGVEGVAAKIYFRQVFNQCNWSGRRPRIKHDYINASLDIGYTILFNYVDAILQTYGFDTYYGVFHKCFYMRKSLVCDLIEALRPIIDMQLRKSINLKQCKEEDFQVFSQKYALSWNENAKYIEIFLKAILEHQDEIFRYIRDYYRMFMKGDEKVPVFQIR